MHKRVYRLQFDDDNGSLSCSCCESLGLVATFSRVSEDFRRSISKLSNDLVDEVILPCFANKHPEFPIIKEKLLVEGKKVSVVTHNYKNVDGLLVLDDLSICPENLNRDILLVLKKGKLNVKKISNIHKGVTGNLYYYAPLKTKFFENKLSIRNVYKLIRKIKKIGYEVRPYPGLSVIETRAPIDLDYEPFYPGLRKEKTNKKFSFIIPVFEQQKYILRVLDCIESQQYDLDKVEVIIIDDGGADKLKDALDARDFIVDVKYHYLQREIHREMGDFRFRAGIARNLGANIANGEIIFFLDADVLIPKTALLTVEKEIKESVLLQIKRFDLNQYATKSYVSINQVDMKRDIIYDGRSYWYDFFKQKEDWNNLKDSWKYVCTYGLCIRRDDFYNYGGFQNNYVGYGFEDTDLGFRVYKDNGKFKLSEVVSFHQYHNQERSEFNNSHYARKRILSRTAKMFFLNNLSSEIYEGLRDYM
jgi:glycosyltransferase involved in cell wall biosynthesis